MPDSGSKLKMYPLAWLLLALLAIFMLDRWLPIIGLIPKPFGWAGLIFIIPGILIVFHSGASSIDAKTGLLPLC